MADAPYQEGAIAEDDAGNQLVFRNGAWAPNTPSTIQDIGKVTVPALEKGGVALMTLPHTLANMAASGVNALGESQFADWPQSMPGRAVKATEEFTGRNAYPTVISDIEKESGPFYQAKTPGGKVWEGALSTAPMGVLGGPEAIVPNVVRALLSGGASETAGQLMAGSPYEGASRVAAGIGAYGAPGMGWRPAITPNTPRAAMARTLEGAGVPVSAADISGSRLTSTLEGQPPSGQVSGLSDAMKRLGGVTRPAGNVDTFSKLLEQRGKDLSQAVQGLEANTSMPATPALRQQLTQPIARHLANYSGTSLENPALQEALNDYDAVTMHGALSGKNYHDLTDKWSNSGAPELREMANSLHGAMDTATANTPLAGAWSAWRQNWADLQGLKAASEAAGGEGTLKPLSPDAVVSSMHKRTPMRDVAEAGQGILGTRPPSYNLNTPALAGAASLLGLGAGHAVATGADAGIEGFLAGGAVPLAGQLIASPAQAVFRSRPGQNFLRNLDPKMVAALLANQGIQAKAAAASQQPQDQAQ